MVQPTTGAGPTIVHDDDDIVVVDKPAGVAAHPSVGWSGPTCWSHLAAAGFRISTSGVPERHGIVQRLDVGTSGMLVVAKSEVAYTVLKRAFRSRTVDKTYHTLVQGHPDPSSAPSTHRSGDIRAPTTRWRSAGGRPSMTHYDTLDAFVGTTLLRCTWRPVAPHQIRVHMAAIHHPCVGDPTYGGDPVLAARLGLERQWLHAVGLGSPSGRRRAGHLQLGRPGLQHALESSGGVRSGSRPASGRRAGDGRTGTDPFARVARA